MVIFDIETAPIADAAQYIESASAPANYKDEAKIKAYIADANQQALSRAALDVDLCRVVCIGLWRDTGICTSTHVEVCPDEATERTAIREFWASVGNMRLAGFNVLDFDLPVLLRRSLYLGIDAPKLDIGRYKHPRVDDLMQILSFDGKLKFRGLDFYGRRFNLVPPVELGDDDLPGAEIGAAVERGEWERIKRHCAIDIWKTVALAQRIGLLCDADMVA